MLKKTRKKKVRKLPQYTSGRHLSLTRDLLEQIDGLLRMGNFEKHVYQALDIPESTWYNWKAQARQIQEQIDKGTMPLPRSQIEHTRKQLLLSFLESTRRGKARAIVRNMGYIQQAGERNYRAAIWYLKQMEPDVFGDPDTLNINAGNVTWEEIQRRRKEYLEGGTDGDDEDKE